VSSRRWLILIVLAGALLRLFPIWFGLPYGSARPDEEVSTGVASRMLRGDLNPRFFHWPSFTFYLFAALYAIAGAFRRLATDTAIPSYTQQVLIGRAAVALAGTATLIVLFRLGRRAVDEKTGLIAAALLAVALLHVRESHFAMADVLMTFWVTLALGLLIRAVEIDTPRVALRWYAAAGLAGGLAVSTKYNAAAILASIAVAQLLVLSRNWRMVFSAGAWLPSIAFGLTFFAGFLIATPYALLDSGSFRLGITQIREHLSDGHGLDLGRGWVYHLRYSLPFGLGLATFAASLIGIVPFVRRSRRAAMIVGAFVIAVYVAVGSGYTVFFRYILPIVPILCLTAAVAIREGATWLSSHARVGERAALVGLLSTAVIPGVIACVWFDLLLARTDTRVLAARWLVERLGPEDSLYDGGGVYAGLSLHSAKFQRWDFDAVAESFRDQGQRTPDWLVVHESPLTMYAQTPLPVRQLASRDYLLVATMRATRSRARSAVYDQHDAFFMPMSAFSTVVRPGPTVRIYRRKGED
jgi:4-amino-4-deoxy-L-arabinose transferase-like glycosyltransferase